MLHCDGDRQCSASECLVIRDNVEQHWVKFVKRDDLRSVDACLRRRCDALDRVSVKDEAARWSSLGRWNDPGNLAKADFVDDLAF